MLKDRNFAIATTAMFFLGFVLYASTVLIPQLLQELMGYTAQLAGMALSPGGAVIMCMMPVVGILVSKVDTRILITFGCIVSASALFVMAGWDLGWIMGTRCGRACCKASGWRFCSFPSTWRRLRTCREKKPTWARGSLIWRGISGPAWESRR